MILPILRECHCHPQTTKRLNQPRNNSSAYSLSGHITIAASSSSSILGLSRSSTHNLTLSSLELTFEGQSELLLTDVGYAPLRLISITKELVSPSHPVQITADEDRAEWRVVFNLAIPGWLPATCNFGKDENQDQAGVSYALYAHARFHPARADIDDPSAVATAASSSTSSMWTNLRSVVRLGAPRPKIVQAEKVPIRLTRYVSPPTRAYSAEDASPAFPLSTFAVRALSECTPDENPSTNIPAEILRSVELHTVVPSRTSVEDDSVPLLLRLRSRLDDEATGSRLRVLGFEANIMQVEEFQLVIFFTRCIAQSHCSFTALPLFQATHLSFLFLPPKNNPQSSRSDLHTRLVHFSALVLSASCPRVNRS